MVFAHVLVLTLDESLRGSHGLSARRARRTKSKGPKGLQLEVGARRAPKLLVCFIFVSYLILPAICFERVMSDLASCFHIYSQERGRGLKTVWFEVDIH